MANFSLITVSGFRLPPFLSFFLAPFCFVFRSFPTLPSSRASRRMATDNAAAVDASFVFLVFALYCCSPVASSLPLRHGERSLSSSLPSQKSNSATRSSPKERAKKPKRTKTSADPNQRSLVIAADSDSAHRNQPDKNPPVHWNTGSTRPYFRSLREELSSRKRTRR